MSHFGTFVVGSLALSAFLPLVENSAATVAEAPNNVWQLDYGEAVKSAKESRQMLLVYFRDDDDTPRRKGIDDFLTKDEAVHSALSRFALCKVPRSEEVSVQGEKMRLIEHPAFADLQQQAGLAMIDYTDVESPHFGHVVSIYPLSSRRHLDQKQLLVLLGLPTGSLTQRTLIFAVRTHPEMPASTQGEFTSLLASESESHSQYQADIAVQGHHHWDSRFHRINARLPSGMLAQEVCAESWPGQGLVDAAIECVGSWRQSPGHWAAVRSRQPYFGYDMKRGSNGVWYATGIFARRQ